MKRKWLFAGSTIAVSLAIALGITLFSENQLRSPRVTPTTPHEMAGQTDHGGKTSSLNRGSLQQNLDGVQPAEYIEIETDQTLPEFTKEEFTVHSGKVVSITLRNQSIVRHLHGWVLVNPGSLETIKDSAKHTDPNWQEIPNTPDLLAFIPLTQPGQSNTILFRAPDKPGEYPFFCPYPGHENDMKGILHVVK